jgi:hypothetical protein
MVVLAVVVEGKMKKNVTEKEMTSAQKKKREEIVLSMKKNQDDLKKRYGNRWEEVMYATATKQAMGESVKPDFLDLDKDGNKKESMKKAALDKKKKKVNEGVLDSTDDDGWMAKSQLYKLAKYAAELHKMIDDSDNLEPWVQAKITAASEDIAAVKHYMEYLLNGGDGIESLADEMEPTIEPTIEPTVGPPEARMAARSPAPITRMPESKEPVLDDYIRSVPRSKFTEAKKKSLRNPKDNPCWDGYEPVGTKKVKGKTVPNCVPKK